MKSNIRRIMTVSSMISLICIIFLVYSSGLGAEANANGKGKEDNNGYYQINKPEIFADKEFLNLFINNSSFNGNVEFFNCTFDGTVTFYNSTFSKPVSFSKCKFDNNVEFNKTIFIDTLSFDSTNFRNIARFSNCEFRNSTSFDSSNFSKLKVFNCTFLGKGFNKANFFNTTFAGDAKFVNSTFNGASFDNAKFKGIGNAFEWVTFLDNASFENAILNNVEFFNSTFNKVSFNNAEFRGNYDHFYNVTFLKDAEFKGAYFANSSIFFYSNFINNSTFFGAQFVNTEFNNIVFRKNADFAASAFTGQLKIDKSNFNRGAIFDNTKFNGITDISNSKFEDKASFYNATFSKDPNFETASFTPKGLNLNKTEYKKMYIKWDNIGKLNFNETAYQKLIDNFKSLGFQQDANNCYYAFKKDSISGIHGTWFAKLAEWGALYSYGFGVKPEYAFLWSVGWIVFFMGIWLYLSSGNLGIRATALSEIKSVLMPIANLLSHSGDDLVCSGTEHQSDPQCSEPTRILSNDNPLFFSILVFLSGTKFFIDPPEIPKSMQQKSLGKAKTVFIIERALGAIFSVLFLVALSKTIIGST